MSRAAAFLDRDGTLNRRPAVHDYVTSATDFAWLPGSVEGMVALARAGYVLVIVSNQRGVARGHLAVEVLHEIETLIQDALAEHRCRVEAFRYCLHDIADACGCRKPAPGMLLASARELDLDLTRSWMIGDSEIDVAAGRAAGCRAVLLSACAPAETKADLVAPSLREAGLRLAAQEGTAASNSATSER
jgi:D-glycero-D-manno-heptose 1,7-bisphosphate phosphatase